MWKKVLVSLLSVSSVLGFVHPISIHGHYFVDSVTKEPVSHKQSLNLKKLCQIYQIKSSHYIISAY